MEVQIGSTVVIFVKALTNDFYEQILHHHIIVLGCRLFRKFCLLCLKSAVFLRFCAPTHDNDHFLK